MGHGYKTLRELLTAGTLKGEEAQKWQRLKSNVKQKTKGVC